MLDIDALESAYGGYAFGSRFLGPANAILHNISIDKGASTFPSAPRMVSVITSCIARQPSAILSEPRWPRRICATMSQWFSVTDGFVVDLEIEDPNFNVSL